jgi:hypothetical protein
VRRGQVAENETPERRANVFAEVAIVVRLIVTPVTVVPRPTVIVMTVPTVRVMATVVVVIYQLGLQLADLWRARHSGYGLLNGDNHHQAG